MRKLILAATLAAGLAFPVKAGTAKCCPNISIVQDQAEIDPATLEYLLKEVEERTGYLYQDLERWFQESTLTISPLGEEEFLVRIEKDTGGIGDIILIDAL